MDTVPFDGMGRRSKQHQAPAQIRFVVAANVKGLRDSVYASLPNETQRNRKLAADVGTTLSQVQRIISSSVGVSIDMLEGLSRALHCRPQDLLTPYFSHGQAPVEFPTGTLSKRLAG
jgi:DNA-binding Xre family transcriptional regulator